MSAFFSLISRNTIPSLNIELQEYRHKVTGARHLHLHSEDNNNVFLVAFLTIPQDSTGVAHILEHTSLCGSKRYPVRDPFFMMTRRSLNTFMNAFTSSDWTAYPFASQNKKDFNNLLQVYLDAVFFPLLTPEDFAQEGHRLEFETPDDPNTPLVYKGIVFNEMKGAMSAPTSVLGQEVDKHLFPSITYHHNSGGEPENIPDLTYEQLKAFHAKHYHPSNALFITYGNIPASEHQEYMQDCALAQFEALDADFSIPDEQRLSQPITATASYPLDGEDDPKDKTHILLAWLLGHSMDMREMLHASLLDGVLLNDSASPLRHALETTDLGAAPSPLCGLDNHSREMGFACGLEGSNPEQAQALEDLIFKVLNDIADQGIATERLEAIVHQMELARREISGSRFPYGLQLILGVLSPTLHGGEPLSALDMDAALIELRQAIQDPEFIKNLVKTQLLDNPHRVRLTMTPDPKLSQAKIQVEMDKLAQIKAKLNQADKQTIIEQAAKLKARQNEAADPNCLPKVTLVDVADELAIAEGSSKTLANMPSHWYAQGTNGMVYQQVIVDVPVLDAKQAALLPLYTDLLPEMGIGKQDYMAVQQWQSAVSGGIGCSYHLYQKADKIKANLIVSGKALASKQAEFTELLYKSFSAVRFDEQQRIKELIAQMRLDAESSVTGRGHLLAMTAASSSINPLAQIKAQWQGLAAIQSLQALDKRIQDADELKKLSQALTALHDKLQHAPRQLLIISDADQQATLDGHLQKHWPAPSHDDIDLFTYTAPVDNIKKQAWRTNTQVNFVAKAYPAVGYEHPDAPALLVLSAFLRNGSLHSSIREQGGAYGGGATYDSDTGIFRFFSYRDPHLLETLAAFDHAIDWLASEDIEERQLEEAILGIISGIDRPSSPAGEAKGAFFSALYGRSPEQRRAFRQQVLKVSLEDLRRVGKTYLQADKAYTAVISNAATLDKLAEDSSWDYKSYQL